MTDTLSKRIARTVLLLSAVTPPTAMAFLGAFQSEYKVLSIILLIIYETLLMLGSVFSEVTRALVGRWNNRLVDGIDNALRRATSRFTYAYLRNVRAANQYLDMKGLSTRGEYSLSLDELFVQLSIDPEAVHNLSADPLTPIAVRNDREHPIWYWMKRASDEKTVLSIIGPPGSGKTTLLKHVAYVHASGGGQRRRYKAERRIPVLIALRDYSEAFGREGGPPSLVELMRLRLADLPVPEPPGWVESKLRAGRLVVMLDGLDEFPEAKTRENTSRWVDKQRELYPETLFVITSRPFGYKSNPINVATVVQVKPFNEKQVRAFLQDWYRGTSIRSHGEDNDAARLEATNGYEDLIHRLEASPALLQMAINPLLLTMAAHVHYYRGALPGSRAELYGEVCEVFLAKRHQAKGIPVDMNAAQTQFVLQVLAYSMMVSGVRNIAVSDASELLKAPLARVAPDLSVPQFLRKAEESSGLLLERESEVYGFAHHTFQEYLAACHIKENGLTTEMCERLHQPWWHETARLYAAQSDVTPIVMACLAAENRARAAMLALAVDCIEDGREVGPEARDLMNKLLHPEDWRTNPESRKMAGAIRLLQRSRLFERIAEDTYLSHEAITQREYQTFLELYPGNAPDHWCDNVYSEPLADTPIDGLRYADVVAFCDWLSGLFGDGRQYTLPYRSEARSVRKLTPERFDLSSYWLEEAEPSDQYNAGDPAYISAPDDIFRYPLSRPPAQFGPSAYPADEVAFIIQHDVARVLGLRTSARREDWLELALPIPDSALAPPFFRATFHSHLRDVWNEIGPLDVGRLNAEVEAVAQECYRVGQAAEGGTTLLSLAQGLQSACSISLNRASVPGARCGSLKDVRAIARLLTLQAGSICEGLEVHPGSTVQKSGRFSLPRWLRFLRSPGSLQMKRQPNSPEPGEMASLDYRLYWILASLLLLEMRITGGLAGSGGLVIVRRSSEIGDD